MISTKAKPHSQNPLITTLIETVRGNRVEVSHVSGKVTFVDLYDGFKKNASKPRLVVKFIGPGKNNDQNICFEEIVLYTPDETVKSKYLKINDKWYKTY